MNLKKKQTLRKEEFIEEKLRIEVKIEKVDMIKEGRVKKRIVVKMKN